MNKPAAPKTPPRGATPPSPTAQPARREARRDRVRTELINAGMELFKQRGFDATTVNDIVAAVSISPRSFFRYFKTKDDLAMDWIDRQGAIVGPVLAARPSSEAPLQAMEQAFIQLAEYHDAHRKQTDFLTRLIFETPSLTGRYHQEQSRWEELFVTTLLRARALGPEELFALRVQVATSTTAFVTAVRSWAAAPGKTLLKPWVCAAFQTLNSAAAGKVPHAPATSPSRAARPGSKSSHRA